jgi:CheY-like chemotaxis protein
MSEQTERARVLVADDEASIRFVLREAIEGAGHEVVDVDTGDAAWQALAEGPFAIAFLDIRMPGPSGLELLDRLRGSGSDVAVVVITAQNTLENAVEAMKRGALDYLVKPFRMAEVLAAVQKALRTRSLEREVRALRREAGERGATGDRLVGRSNAILDVFKTIGRVAPRSWRGLTIRRARARRAPSWPSTPPRSRAICSRASCSATRRARSPAPSRRARAVSARRPVARCSSTRSATCRSNSRRSYCAS